MPATTAMDASKKLSIKANIVKRCTKELAMYRKELEEQRSRIEKMQATDSTCSHDLRKQFEILEETRNILPDCAQRLQQARADLAHFFEHCDQTALAAEVVENVSQLLATSSEGAISAPSS